MNDLRLLHLAPTDNVCVVTADLQTGEEALFGDEAIRVMQQVPVGHKVCVRAIAPGEKVVKYGAPIGSATQPIAPGEHVHTHNLASDYLPSAGRETLEEPA